MKLYVTFSEVDDRTFNVRLQQDNETFDADFGQVQHITEYLGGEPFDGEYIVTPKVAAQIMPTKQKLMLDDVLVTAIPYAETQNTSNGRTVTIG